MSDMTPQQKNQLQDYILNGSVTSLQSYFSHATDGFSRLVSIANGEFMDGDRPSFSEQIQAMKLIMDKAFPSLKASHVTQHHVSEAKMDNVDASGLLEELDVLMAQAKEMKKAEMV